MEIINKKDIVDAEVVNTEEKKVTVEEALEVANSNMYELDTQIGKVKFSKGLYNVCAGIGGLSAGVGVVGVVLSAPIIPIVAAVGFGTAATVYSVNMARKERRKEDALIEEYDKNVDYVNNVLAKRK